MKLRTTLNRETTIRATISFPVEFDTETGETEIVGDGRVVQHEEIRKRRMLQHQEDPEELDQDTYKELLTGAQIPIPKPGETVMLSGESYVLDPEYGERMDDDENKEDPENIVMFLERQSGRRHPHRRQLRRRRRLAL